MDSTDSLDSEIKYPYGIIFKGRTISGAAMESNNVSQRMFGYLLINIMSNSHYFYLVKSTTHYVTAYRELRKERLVAADDVDFIVMLEGVLDEAQTAKVRL